MATARTFLAALCLALSGCAATGQPEPSPAAEFTSDGEVTIPADLVISSPRICAALAVYELSEHDDWGLRATIAGTALNGFRAAEGVPNCAAGVAGALTNNFSERRWLLALEAVDAVNSGSYSVPLACARATAVVPLSAADARAHCVIYDLAFVGGGS